MKNYIIVLFCLLFATSVLADADLYTVADMSHRKTVLAPPADLPTLAEPSTPEASTPEASRVAKIIFGAAAVAAAYWVIKSNSDRSTLHCTDPAC